MSWKVHETDEVFAALRGLCANSYRMYAPFEYRYHYDHDCETYDCAVEDAAQEYERLLRHCDHQREQLKAWCNVPTLRKIMEDGMDNIDGGTEVGRIEGSSKVRAGSSITDELREFIETHLYLGATALGGWKEAAFIIADRIDAEHAKAVERAYGEGVMSVPIALDESQWVKLPVDADGVPIKVGDEIEIEHSGRVTTVTNINYNEHGWLVYCSEGGGFDEDTRCHHVKPDSWERIIEDALSECGWEQPKEYEIDFEDSKEVRDRFVAELVERCRKLAGGA